MKEISLTPLGTVSTYQTQTKNCPGFLVNYNEHKIILDAGNGITRNMNIPQDLINATIIISHLHPDHYGELLSIAQTSLVLHRLGYLNKKIKVYIPQDDKVKTTENYTDTDGWGASRQIEKNLIDYDYLLSLQDNSFLEFVPYIEKDKLLFDDLEVTFSLNPHPIITYSTCLNTDGIKIVYSSDTGYQKNTVTNLSKNANLLICESTFLIGQQRLEDYHLFAHEAAQIAKDANVEKLLLTHFWPSIDKQLYVDEARKIFQETYAAEEGQKLVLRKK